MFVSQVAFNGSGLEVMQCMQCFVFFKKDDCA